MLRERATAVAGITLRIGPLSGVEPALVRAAYLQVRRNSVAEHAELLITEVPVRIYCMACGAESRGAVNRLSCPRCGCAETVLKSGDDMLLESVDLVF